MTEMRLTTGHWYSSIATHFFNVVLVFALVNIIMGGALAIKDERDRHQLPAAFRAIKERHGPSPLSILYPGWDESAVVTLYDEWNQLTHEYDAFTQFKLRAARGSYINVSEHGFRLNGQGAPWPPDAAAFNIFVFGGSTTFGTGLPDTQTISAALERHLRAQSCTSMAYVYNFARPGYLSIQERALFEQLLLSGAAPHVAVFIDGLNDSVWQGSDPQYTDALRRMMDLVNVTNVSWRWYSWAREFVASLPIARVAQLLRARLGRSTRQGEPAGSAIPSANISIEGRVSRWIVNKQLVEAAAQQFGIKALFVSQPVPTYNYDLKYHLFANDLLQWRSSDIMVAQQSKAFYELMNKRRDDADVRQNLLWLGDIQGARRENLYVDSLHYTAAFSREIALAIADDMGRRDWMPCARPKAG